jgi:hypothetical protein
MLQCSTAWYGIRSCDNSVARTHLKHFKALQNDCCKQVEHENAVEHDKQTEEYGSHKVLLAAGASSPVAVWWLHRQIIHEPSPVIICHHSY